jgi:lipoprotein-releasing system permease protein
MLKLFLWLRYLGKRKVVGLSVAAVALSSALLIVVVSLFTGFINAFEQSAADAMGDVVLTAHGIKNYQELTGELEQLKPVEAATATLSAQGLLHLGQGNVRAVEIWGIEVEKQGKVTAFEKALLKKGSDPFFPSGDKEAVKGYIGIGVLCEPNEKTDEYDINKAESATGREAVLTTGSTSSVSGKPEGKQQFKRQTIRFAVANIVFTGVYYLDNQAVYIPIERLQKAVYPGSNQPMADQIHIKLRKGADAESAIAQIRGVWKVFATDRLSWDEYEIEAARIETAKQMQGRFMAEVRKQMGVLLLIFGVVSMSAVLLVFCIFYMIVETRRKDVAILKSCGATSTAVAIIFTGFGVFVGILGALFGTAIGYLVTKNINVVEGWIRILFGLKLWKASVYMFSRIPSEVDWQGVLWIALAAIAGAAIGAALPAISAAMTRPVNVLRYE